jgi:hypothetical protein
MKSILTAFVLIFLLSSCLDKKIYSDNEIKNVMQLNEFFKLDGMLFQNLGIDFNQQKLRFKKIPNDSLVSPIYHL